MVAEPWPTREQRITCLYNKAPSLSASHAGQIADAIEALYAPAREEHDTREMECLHLRQENGQLSEENAHLRAALDALPADLAARLRERATARGGVMEKPFRCAEYEGCTWEHCAYPGEEDCYWQNVPDDDGEPA